MAQNKNNSYDDLKTPQACNAAIQEIMKKYRFTMYAVLVCVLVYLVGLFAIRNTVVVLITCIPMIILAVMNNRYGKQIRKIAARRTELNKEIEAEKKEEERQLAIENGEEVTDVVYSEEPVKEDAKSLNDLPKEYTVLDHVAVGDEEIDHIVLSPYGLTIVDENDSTDAVHNLIEDLNINVPIYYVKPEEGEDISVLAARIQEPRQVVLTEQEIFKILYRLNGLD